MTVERCTSCGGHGLVYIFVMTGTLPGASRAPQGGLKPWPCSCGTRTAAVERWEQARKALDEGVSGARRDQGNPAGGTSLVATGKPLTSGGDDPRDGHGPGPSRPAKAGSDAD